MHQAFDCLTLLR